MKRKALLSVCICLLLAVLIVGYRWGVPGEYGFGGSVMGTTYHIKYIARGLSSKEEKQIADTVSAQLHRVDSSMSTYKPESELMKLNAWPVGRSFSASHDLMYVLEQSLAVSGLSKGAYDVTVGPLVNLWGFGPVIKNLTGTGDIGQQAGMAAVPGYKIQGALLQPPSQQAVREARSRVGYKNIQLNKEALLIEKKKDVFIDLSSIAKGYGVDQAARALDQLGLHHYMVEVGGEVRAGGYRIDHSLWKVAVNSPVSGPDKFYALVELHAEGMATSGDYLNYYKTGNMRYNHEINPKTGLPEQNNIASVTVIAKNTMLADAYSTMFMILGQADGQKLAEEQGIAVYILYRDRGGQDFTGFISKAFKPYLVDAEKRLTG